MMTGKPLPSMVDIQWKKRDKDGNGKLDRNEFKDMCFDLGYFFDEDELEKAFTLLDSDGSGFVEKAEFMTFWRTDDRFDKLRLNAEQTGKLIQLRDFFLYFDKDRSGKLDPQEFKKLCQEMEKRKYDLKRLNFNMDALDKDGDGFVTFNEFIAKMIDHGGLDSGDARPVHG